MAEINKEYLEEVINTDFEIVDGLLLRKGTWNDKSLSQWKKEFKNDERGIESVINHIHLTQFYWLANDEFLEHEDLVVVGNRIQAAWKKKLKIEYPKLNIDVIFESNVEADGFLGNMNVTVRQSR